MTMRFALILAACMMLGTGAACRGGKSASPVQGAAATLATVGSATVTTASESESTPFKVLSSTDYLSSHDTYEIYGEVRNNTNLPSGEITVSVQLLDASNRLVPVSTSETSALRTVTPPGETSPFDLIFPNGKQLKSRVAAYELTAAGQPTENQPVQGLRISGEKVATAQGGYTLTGRLTNTGQATVKAPAVVATFYDGDGKVVRVGWGVFSSDAFAPGQGDDFTFAFDDGGKAGIARYVLVAQGEQ
jgi:hypothetical protein